MMNSGLFKDRIVLENNRVKLIPFDDDRVQELQKIVFDDDVWKYMGMYIRAEDDLTNYIRSTLEQKALGNCYPFLIVDKNTDRVAGSTRYGYLNIASEKCEIGWTWYGKKFQGTGLNKACKYALLEFGFTDIGFRRIQFSTDLENIRSQKAIEKLGATREGLFRNNYIDSEGQSRHDVYYSIIREDWGRIKREFFPEFA